MRKKIATLVILCLMLTQWVGLAHAVADFDHNKHTVMNTTNATIGNFTPTTPADHLHVNKGCKECHNSCHSHCHSHFFVQDTIFISASVVKKNLPFNGNQSFKDLTHTPDAPPPNTL